MSESLEILYRLYQIRVSVRLARNITLARVQIALVAYNYISFPQERVNAYSNDISYHRSLLHDFDSVRTW